MSGLVVDLAAMTHNGAVRSSNQDRVAFDNWSSSESMTEPLGLTLPLDRPRLMLVCDGMGGQAGGEVASAMAVNKLARLADCNDEDAIAKVIQHASGAIHAAAEDDAALQWMGSTVAGLLLGPDGGFWFNVGDSAVFRFRGALMKQSLDDVPTGERSGQLTQALGGTPVAKGIDPHVGALSLADGLTYLLCSDGLTDVLSFEDIEACLEHSPTVAASRLVESVVAAGGHDNVSVVIARVHASEEGEPDGSQD